MLSALALWGLVATCAGQVAEFVPPPLQPLAVPAGEAAVSLRLEAKEALKAGDQIILSCDRTDLPIRILLPDGTEFDKTTADEHGFDWDYVPYTAPFGKSDGGERLRIEAQRGHPSGIYTVTVSGPRPQAEILGAIHLYPPPPAPEVVHEEILKLFPEARRVGPETVPGRTKDHVLPIEVGKDADGDALFEVVVPDRTVKVRLEMPDGTILDPSMPASEDQKWEVKDGPLKDEDPDPWNLFDFTKLYLPYEGPHHFIGFPKVSKGTHRIHLDTTASVGPIVVHAMYLPIVQVLNDIFGRIDPGAVPTPDRVQLSVDAPGGEAHVGDELSLFLTLHGPALSEPVNFKVEVETSPLMSGGMAGRREYAEPRVEAAALEFRQRSPLRYVAKYVAVKPGLLRFSVKATGNKADGTPFEATAVERGPVVNAVSARFRSTEERAVDEDADGYPDRLDVRVELEVAVEGEYAIEVNLNASNEPGGRSDSLSARRTAQLKTGRQTLIVSIRAETLRERMKSNGPYFVPRINIQRLQGNLVADIVDTPGETLVTRAYRLTDWIGTSSRASRVLQWRAADRLGTGKGQMLEIDWPVVSPGGRCRWGGTFVRLTGEGRFEVPTAEAVLAEGEVLLPVDLVANRLLPFGSSVWRFEPSLTCDSSHIEVAVPIDRSPRIPFSASAFEPLQRGMLMRRLPPVLVVAGQPNNVVTTFEKGGGNRETVQVVLAAAPETIECKVNSATVGGWVITPRSDTPPGEYEVVLGLDSAGVKSTMAIRVIISAPEAKP